MFSGKHRIHSRCFDEILKKGTSVYHGVFRLFFIKTEGFKMAVVVPKKVAKLSVIRHRIKRRVVSLLKKIHNIPDTGNYIIFVQKNILDSENDSIATELNGLFDKIK